VIYLGTFSKVLFPALRLGYMVVPSALIEAFITAQRAANIRLPTLEQAALATFMQEGHFARHIRRMRALYAERGSILRDYASRYLGDMLTIERPVAGLHLVGWLPEGVHDGEMARQAERYHITAPALSAYRLQSTGRGGVLLGYASLTESEIKDGMQRLAQAWEHYRLP
jgi:GntR family transcriptional regulator/MocR family aminotransferase